MQAHNFAVLLGLVSLIVPATLRAEDGPNPPALSPSRAGETLKERLSDKASDDQRVNNCKVPLNRRGAKIRPDTCSGDAASDEASGPHR